MENLNTMWTSRPNVPMWITLKPFKDDQFKTLGHSQCASWKPKFRLT